MAPSVYRIGGERILGNRPANDRMSHQPGFPGPLRRDDDYAFETSA